MNQKSAEQLEREGREAFEREDWSLASANFEALYEKQQTEQNNHLLVEALYLDQRYQAAQQYAADFVTTYLTDHALFNLLISLLVHNHRFIEAREMAMDPVVHQDWLPAALQEIQDGERVAKSEMKETIQTVSRQFYHLSDQSFSEQKRRFDAALALPLDNYLVGAKYLLLDPFLHPLLRSSLLEVLQQLQYQEEIELLWLDEQRHKIGGQQLPLLGSISSVQAVNDEIQRRLGHDDPMAEQMITQQAQLEMMYLYPFNDRVVTDPQLWVDRLIQKYRAGGVPVDVSSSAEEQVDQWQKKLDQYTTRLMH
ncbi:type I restriction endonuclease subunit R [Levilactobacillus bambusae]|uniref:Type I restriction endonuclease subunit R n=1 Tax=Levilactobacillus bambusae TaxID=2024736 RepID=A0A2V1N0Z0_9LACO|nr:type I restriction endonuclease subunit R [Levilactobacillus bambusae]PWG00683.1 type I restriction endonuclease subunit R [Levilactobacillus bambusae]